MFFLNKCNLELLCPEEIPRVEKQQAIRILGKLQQKRETLLYLHVLLWSQVWEFTVMCNEAVTIHHVTALPCSSKKNELNLLFHYYHFHNSTTRKLYFIVKKKVSNVCFLLRWTKDKMKKSQHRNFSRTHSLFWFGFFWFFFLFVCFVYFCFFKQAYFSIIVYFSK